MKSWIKQSLFFGGFAVLGLFIAAAGLIYQAGGPKKMLQTWLQQPVYSPQTAEELKASYAVAVEKAAPAVVNVYVDKTVQQTPMALLRNPQLRQFTGTTALIGRTRNVPRSELGSGVILSTDGYILTNYHVIKGAEGIKIALWDGRVTQAEIVGYDEETDLAVLQIEIDQLPRAAIAAADQLHVGDVALAIGNPFGLGQTVTMGIVSATGRGDLEGGLYQDFIQTDAAINRGNSGGALINTRGEILGINTSLLERGSGAEGIGFAIPVTVAQDVMQQILTQGQVIRGWLGVEFDDIRRYPRHQQLNKTSFGAIITAIYRGSPAEQAGLQAGDVLTSFKGQPVTITRQLYRAIADTPPGDQTELGIIRNGQQFGIIANLIQRPRQINESG